MHQGAILGSGFARGGVAGSGVVRRAYPASGAQWNVQVVRGKVNGKCLWNACKALSLGLLLMVLGAAMATIGYYADHLSMAQEVRGNHTIRVKNETRGFHLNNLSYAGPIVMGVGGFIVVAACVMTFEARDSAAKVVPARLKVSGTGPSTGIPSYGHVSYSGHSAHSSLRTSGSQTGPGQHQHSHHLRGPPDRRALTQSFMQFSKGLAIETQNKNNSLKPQGSISKSPSAPDLALERTGSQERTSPVLNRCGLQDKVTTKGDRKTFAACALLNPGLLHRHAISVDETAGNYRLSHESLQGSDQGSMALDLHLDCPVTLRVRDRRRNPLRRQRRVDEDERQGHENTSRRSSHSCSPRMSSHHVREFNTTVLTGGSSVHQLPTHSSHCHPSNRRSSNASDCTHRVRSRRHECPHSRGRLERAISQDSRLTGGMNRCHGQPVNTEREQPASSSDTDIRRPHVTHTNINRR